MGVNEGDLQVGIYYVDVILEKYNYYYVRFKTYKPTT